MTQSMNPKILSLEPVEAPVVPISRSVPKVLVADDDPEARSSLERIMQAEGYQVTCVANGLQAQEKMREEGFDLLLTDVQMPELDGIQLLRWLREEDVGTPVIFVTGNPSVDSAIEAMNNSVLGYLSKPCNPPEVIAAARRARSFSRAQHMNAPCPVSIRTQRAKRMAEQFEGGLAKLFMHFQPIVRWSTRNIYSYEALMRTQSKDIPHPGVFLELAEELKRVKELGRAVRAEVAREIHDCMGEDGLVFVNLHPEELEDESLYDPNSPLAQLAPRIVLEITERESLEEHREAGKKVAQLKSMGYRIAIDDIGAGYSSLTSFIDLDPDIIKLDMGLVRGIHQDARRQKLVRSLVALTSELDIQVIAEGVETMEERDKLVELGCDLLQGYLFSKPQCGFVAVDFDKTG